MTLSEREPMSSAALDHAAEEAARLGLHPDDDGYFTARLSLRQWLELQLDLAPNKVPEFFNPAEDEFVGVYHNMKIVVVAPR